MTCSHCHKPMTEGEYMDGPHCVGTFYECENTKCPYILEEGEAYSEDYDQDGAGEAALEDALDGRNQR